VNTRTLAEITETLGDRYMQYPVYLIKEEETSDTVIYKYTNFINRIVGRVQVNLDTHEVFEKNPLLNESTEGEIYQKVARLLSSSIKKHLMFFFDTTTSNSSTYSVMDHHYDVLGTIEINHKDNEIQINGVKLDNSFLVEQAHIIRHKGFPADHSTHMDIEYFPNSLYILQTSEYKEYVNYLYLNDHDNRIFGRLSVSKLNGSIQLLSESCDEEEGVYQVVEDRLRSCYLEEIFIMNVLNLKR
jgi:hypothetical protein